jgi:hypothetical protein
MFGITVSFVEDENEMDPADAWSPCPGSTS